jgi:hypothetical protein
MSRAARRLGWTRLDGRWLLTDELATPWIVTDPAGADDPGAIEEDGATTVRVVHHGLPPEAVGDHEKGWAYFLGALRETFASR